MEIIFTGIVFLLIIWRTKKGFENGMMKEIISILSLIVACICIILIFFTISSVVAKTYSTFVVCLAGLIGIGTIYKLCNLIFKPVMAIFDLSIIHGLDKMTGAVVGFAEAAVFCYFLYHAMNYFGIPVQLLRF